MSTNGCENANYEKKVSLREDLANILLNFPLMWFLLTMGTGVTAVVLQNLPFKFSGLDVITHIIIIFNLVLFGVILLLTIARYSMWPELVRLTMMHPTEILFLGPFSMSISMFVNYGALALAKRWSFAFSIFIWVLWWIDIVVALCILAGILFLQFTRHTNELKGYNALRLFPVVCVIVASATGGIVSSIVPLEHAKLTINVSWVTFGIGFSVGMMIFVTYFVRLTLHNHPSGNYVFSAFLPLGVCGQSSFVVLKLSSSARNLFVKHGEWLTSPNIFSKHSHGIMADALVAFSIPTGLFLWGFAFVWLFLAIFVVIDVARISRIPFSLSWWGMTFPLAAFALATSELATVLASGFFRVFATVFILIEVIIWLSVIFLTAYNIPRKSFHVAPCVKDNAVTLQTIRSQGYQNIK